MNFQSSKNQIILGSASAVTLLSLYTAYRYKSNIYNYLLSWTTSKK